MNRARPREEDRFVYDIAAMYNRVNRGPQLGLQGAINFGLAIKLELSESQEPRKDVPTITQPSEEPHLI